MAIYQETNAIRTAGRSAPWSLNDKKYYDYQEQPMSTGKPSATVMQTARQSKTNMYVYLKQ
jgi:hypothetical protein